MRFLAFLAIGWCALGVPSAALDRQLVPPNSIEPKNQQVSVHVRHNHRAVLTCLPQSQRSDPGCVATFERRDASTTVRLDPVKTRKLGNRDDSRQPVDLRIASDGEPEAGAVPIESGVWDVAWPGLQARKRFSAPAGSTVGVELETTTGRCERIAGQCFVRADATSKTLEVTVR